MTTMMTLTATTVLFEFVTTLTSYLVRDDERDDPSGWWCI